MAINIFKKIVYLERVQFKELITSGKYTVNGVEKLYDKDTLYLIKVDKTYVNTVEDQTISGHKTFTNSIEIQPIDETEAISYNLRPINGYGIQYGQTGLILKEYENGELTGNNYSVQYPMKTCTLGSKVYRHKIECTVNSNISITLNIYSAQSTKYVSMEELTSIINYTPAYYTASGYNGIVSINLSGTTIQLTGAVASTTSDACKRILTQISTTNITYFNDTVVDIN